MSQKKLTMIYSRYVKVKFKLNKPAHIWMCILDLSKVFIYEFHYNYIKNKYGNSSRQSVTDTDSSKYEIQTEDIYWYFSRERFDSSDSPTLKYYYNSNKLVVGKMKDETSGVDIEEFVGLKSKMFLLLVDHSSKYKKRKRCE